MTVFHVSAECYPIAKVGGLADVVGSLPKYQTKLGLTSKVIMPFYNNTFTQQHEFKTLYSDTLWMGYAIDYRILTLEDNSLGYELYLVDIPHLLFKDYVYSSNDTDRFLAFQIAVLDWMLQMPAPPDVVHCHDHHTGLIPFMMSQSHKYAPMRNTPSVVTIHNAQYQGWFSHDKVGLIPEFNFYNVGLLDWNHTINPLAAAIKCAWRVTTVSPNYMEELKQRANGLESLLQYESGKCVGILNGIDTSVWNPKSDDYLVKNYNLSSIVSGKKANKDWLCEQFDLDPSLPLFVFIGRLVGEKGADLFPYIFDVTLRNLPVSILMLGSGDKGVEHRLEQLKPAYKGKYNTYIGYNEKLSHIMYAGADFLLMPSRVEPCGLNQMYALKYGTVPIVNAVGGLKDTVVDIAEGGFGVRHYGLSVEQVVEAIHRALYFYNDTDNFKKNRKAIMQIDHSWDASAEAYNTLYSSLKK